MSYRIKQATRLIESAITRLERKPRVTLDGLVTARIELKSALAFIHDIEKNAFLHAIEKGAE